MAELIPFEYRIKRARSQRIIQWVVAIAFTTVLSGAGVVYAMSWRSQQARELAKINDEYRSKDVLIRHARELRAGRLDLASRMEKIQQLMDDKMLLLLLRSISEGFSNNDCLDYLSVDVHGRGENDAKNPGKFTVRINGVTVNEATLGQLMTRLKKQSSPQLAVTLESSRRENLLDGQVTHFQILCEAIDAAGSVRLVP